MKAVYRPSDGSWIGLPTQVECAREKIIPQASGSYAMAARSLKDGRLGNNIGALPNKPWRYCSIKYYTKSSIRYYTSTNPIAQRYESLLQEMFPLWSG
jgi:hypothetical protein